MAFFKINNVDYSNYINQLKVSNSVTYNSQINAAGNTVVEYINNKRKIEVGIIPVDGEAMTSLQQAIGNFNVSISFRNPKTNNIEENVNCIIPESEVEYYTIQSDKVMYNGFNLTFTEL